MQRWRESKNEDSGDDDKRHDFGWYVSCSLQKINYIRDNIMMTMSKDMVVETMFGVYVWS